MLKYGKKTDNKEVYIMWHGKGMEIHWQPP